MISMTWSTTPADLLGLGGLDVRPTHGAGLCAAERAAAPTAASQGTGLSTGSAAVRLRPVVRRPIGHDVVARDGFDKSTTFENNGTTLGYLSSGRPLS